MTKAYIVHGWTYTTDKWQPLLNYLSSKGFQPEMLKVPGLTESTDRIWNLDDYVDWLHEIVQAEDSVILIGHSNGGRISLAFAEKFPEKVARLILIDSAGIYPRGGYVTLKRTIFKVIAQAGKKLTTSSRLRNLLYKVARERDYNNANPQMRQTMANLISVDLAPALKNITSPTLLIWGARDTATPLADGRLMHRLIVNSKLHVIAAAKHSPQITHWQEVGEIIMHELEAA